ncbi:MAG: hypothetical protein RSD17_06885, partial [Oscillospiraceae bacterium]
DGKVKTSSTKKSDKDDKKDQAVDKKENTDKTTKKGKPEKTQASIGTTSVAKDGSVKISWEAVPGATGYDIFRATTQNGDYSKVGTSKTTSFTDEGAKAGKAYFYKIIAITPATQAPAKPLPPNKTTPKGPTFVGSSLVFTEENNEKTTLSSYKNDYYVAKIISEYTNAGMKVPDGIFVHVTLEGNPYEYVFQFGTTTLWNDTTLMQVQIFKDKDSYFSFFTQDSGTPEYLAAKKESEKAWNKSNKISYADQKNLLMKKAQNPNFKTLHDQSFR